MTPQQVENVKKWIAALRNGEYVRCSEALRKDDESGPMFCCLGVLGDIMDSNSWSRNNHGNWAYGGRCQLLPMDTYEVWVGKDFWSQYTLSQDNDTGKSFKEISDRIERKMNRLVAAKNYLNEVQTKGIVI